MGAGLGAPPMSTWWVASLGDAMLAGEALDALERNAAAAHAAAGHAPAMAVFTRHESEGRLHCELKVYLPPAAAALARGLEAVSCARPMRAGLGLLAGPEDAWATLFPERDEQ